MFAIGNSRVVLQIVVTITVTSTGVIHDCNMFIIQFTDQRQVEYSNHNPKIKGSNPTTGTGSETATKK